MRRTVKSFAASEADRLMAVVVFPTPPFWFVTAITLLKFSYAITVLHVSRETMAKQTFGIPPELCASQCFTFHVKQWRTKFVVSSDKYVDITVLHVSRETMATLRCSSHGSGML